MAKCEYCGKDVSFGIKVSHSHRRSNRTWKPNIKKVKAIVNGSPKRVNVCTDVFAQVRLKELNNFA
jgi:large subunit ribosomal protein L28